MLFIAPKKFRDGNSTSGEHYIEKLMRFDFNNYMVGDVLTKVDRGSMLNSIEFRTPFLNQPVVRFAQSLPLEDKITLKARKIILKDIARKHLLLITIMNANQDLVYPWSNG